MADDPTFEPARWRPALYVLLGTAGFALIAFLALHARLAEPDRAIAPPAAREASAPSSVNPAKPVAPSFDVVRISPNGDTVMAGRAAPGAEIILRQGDHEIGRTWADDRGEWVFLPSEPLAAGARELTLRQRMPDGQEVAGESSVVLVVPERATASLAAAPTAPVAVLSSNTAAPRVLQGGGRLGLGAVEYDDQGRIRFGGGAPAGSRVRVQVDGTAVGEATADASGHWSLLPTHTVAPGSHVLRLQRLDAKGQVAERVELPFQRQAAGAPVLANGQVVVQPGYSLWSLAKQVYGGGTRYTVIYQANKEQIHSPGLIYPGQILKVPNKQP